MRARTLRPLATLVVTAVLCAACGDTPDATGAHAAPRGPHWQVHEGEGGTTPVVLADARHALGDPHGGPRRVVVNVLADDTVILKGRTWAPASRDEAARLASQVGLRAQLVDLTAVAREEGVVTPLPVLLYADREAPWRVIRLLLPVLRESEIDTRHLQWAVRAPTRAGDRSDHRVDGMLQEVVESTPPVLRIVADRGESWTVVRIFSPAGIHSFGPQATRIAEEAFLHRANATWVDLERTLPALAEKHSTAHVEVRDAEADVWFAYVVKTVDLLFGAGFEKVRLPQEGIVLMRPGDGG